jgi:hypothetical protein
MQLVDTAAPVVVRYRPDAHGVHTTESLAPVTVVYWPAEQLVQAVAALEVVYWPAAQALHDIEVGCPVPLEYVPSKQGKHLTAPVGAAAK